MCRTVALLVCLAHAGCALRGISSTPPSELMQAFPGGQGWAAQTPGGRGGQIIRVTTLSRSGPGSLAEAVQAKGPRIVVFEVGGVIDLERENISINEPFLTIAGQTAPPPGITLIRGGVGIRTHDVIVQHIRIRPGEASAAKASGWEVDGLATTTGAYNVIVDHCSLTWATDENLSASGPRFEGSTPEQWRRNTSHRITFSNNIIAEGLSHSTHSKGEHSKGTLIHDNATEVLVTESTDTVVHPLASGARRIVFDIRLTARRPGVSLAGTDDEKGYSGFSVRFIHPDRLDFESAGRPLEPSPGWDPAEGQVAFSWREGGTPDWQVMLQCSADDAPVRSWMLRRELSMQNCAFPGRTLVQIPTSRPLRLKASLIVAPKGSQ